MKDMPHFQIDATWRQAKKQGIPLAAAEGAIVKAPTVTLAGEAGPEAIVPLKGPAAVQVGAALVQGAAEVSGAQASSGRPSIINAPVTTVTNSGGNVTNIGEKRVRNPRSSGNNTIVGQGAS